jgi:hypothetical protein
MAKTLPLKNDRNRLVMAIALLMLIPALPLPTGGITHVTELIALILGFQLAIGKENVWLPKRLDSYLDKQLGDPKLNQRLQAVINKLHSWAPDYTRQWGTRWNIALSGIMMELFILAAFLAPPFSGLDTLPSLGALFLAVAILVDNAWIAAAGFLLGIAGIVLEFLIARTLLHYIHL